MHFFLIWTSKLQISCQDLTKYTSRNRNLKRSIFFQLIMRHGKVDKPIWQWEMYSKKIVTETTSEKNFFLIYSLFNWGCFGHWELRTGNLSFVCWSLKQIIVVGSVCANAQYPILDLQWPKQRFGESSIYPFNFSPNSVLQSLKEQTSALLPKRQPCWCPYTGYGPVTCWT